jgi:hypothetical protein
MTARVPAEWRPAGQDQIEDGFELSALRRIEHRQVAAACSGGRLELVRGVDDALHGVLKLPRGYPVPDGEDHRRDPSSP